MMDLTNKIQQARTELQESIQKDMNGALSQLPPSKHIQTLLITAAQYYICYDFERIYRETFAGQIALLKKMLYENINLDKNAIISFFRAYLKEKKITGIDVQPWLDYLVDNRLLKPNKSKEYKLTERGIVFVDYAFSDGHDGKFMEI